LYFLNESIYLIRIIREGTALGGLYPMVGARSVGSFKHHRGGYLMLGDAGESLSQKNSKTEKTAKNRRLRTKKSDPT